MVDFFSFFSTLSLVVVTGFLAYFTYVLGKHTHTLSKIPIMPHMIEDIKPTFDKGKIFAQYRNGGNGVAVHLEARVRKDKNEEYYLKQTMIPEDSIAVGTVVGYEIIPDTDKTFLLIFKYDDINGNHYKQAFVFHKNPVNGEYYSFESAFFQ